MGQQQPPDIQAEIRETQEILRGYAQAVQHTDGMSFYDTTLLPHPKDNIAKALLLAIKLTSDENHRENLKVMLALLSRFQDDVGENPVRPAPVLPEGDQATPEQIIRVIEAHRPEAAEFALLQERAKAEETAFMDMAAALMRL